MIIKRDYYLNKLINSTGNGRIKTITGIRRCGKSYLLNEIFYNYLLSKNIPNDHIIVFSFIDKDNLELINEDYLDIYKSKRKVDPKRFTNYIDSLIKDNNTYYLLLDEIQELDAFEYVINSYASKKQFDVYVTGSNAKMLTKDIITEFRGRADNIHLYPLSYSEIMQISNKDKYESLSDYMMYGGIPLVVLENDISKKKEILNNLLKETYFRDIYQRYNIKKVSEFDELVNIISSSIGSLNSIEKIKNTFKSVKHSTISTQTLQKYFDILDDSFLINSANRYDIKGKQYIETNKKYYFVDLGLRNAKLNFKQYEETHLMENAIYNRLIQLGYSVDVGIVEIIDNNQRKQIEIDFICNGNRKIYIQSALTIANSNKLEQEIRPFLKTGDFFEKIIITKDNIPNHYDDYGIHYINIYDFLLNDNFGK